jgi:hypothetical protein
VNALRHRRLPLPQPEGWIRRSALGVSARTGLVQLCVEEEGLASEATVERYVELVKERMRALPGYAHAETSEIATAGLPGIAHRFEWKPGSVPLQQLQLVWVHGRSGYVAWAMMPTVLAEADPSLLRNLVEVASRQQQVSEMWHDADQAWRSEVRSWY